jgi:hypothetical protein
MRWHVTLTLIFTLACSHEDPGSSDTAGTTTTSNSDSDSESGTSSGSDTIGFPCDPSADTTCGGQCCSDDPTAILLSDLEAWVTPLYFGNGGSGTPVFSANNNGLSSWGSCEAPTPIGLQEPGAMGCPIPCNPTWSSPDVASVCGLGRVCCQTVELEFEDCVFDPDIGDNGCYRPVTGNDIVGLGGLDATNWGPTAHKTHQDPNGTSCEAFVASLDPGELANNGVTDQEVLTACYRRLGVANVRGFCMDGAMVCPYADPNYVDACEQRNASNFLTGCS